MKRPKNGDTVHVYHRKDGQVTGPFPATVESSIGALVDQAWALNRAVSVRYLDPVTVSVEGGEVQVRPKTLAVHCLDGSKANSITWRWPN